jgi:hypothetical protein
LPSRGKNQKFFTFLFVPNSEEKMAKRLTALRHLCLELYYEVSAIFLLSLQSCRNRTTEDLQ